MAKALDKYRINPGNVGTGKRRDEQFATICGVARDLGRPVRIGVNGGSLNQELVMQKMQENTDKDLGKTSDEIVAECMVLSALQSTELALECGLKKDQIIISCKVSRPNELVAVYRDLAARTDQPLHLGLTEAGMGTKGLVWSSAAMGILLAEGIGDTIRVSLTPRPGGDRREEVYAACELLQALGIRSFAPSVTACPGCGRTTSTTFQELAERIQGYVREQMPVWKTRYEGVETMTLAVMGCIVNGPGESKAANIGISLPGTGEEPSCPVYVDGQKFATLKGNYDELSAAFRKLVDDYVETKYPRKGSACFVRWLGFRFGDEDFFEWLREQSPRPCSSSPQVLRAAGRIPGSLRSRASRRCRGRRSRRCLRYVHPVIQGMQPDPNGRFEPMRPGGEVTEPVEITRVEPDCGKLEGAARPITVELILTKEGAVEGARVLAEAPADAKAAILESVRGWRFRPSSSTAAPSRSTSP